MVLYRRVCDTVTLLYLCVKIVQGWTVAFCGFGKSLSKYHDKALILPMFLLVKTYPKFETKHYCEAEMCVVVLVNRFQVNELYQWSG